MKHHFLIILPLLLLFSVGVIGAAAPAQASLSIVATTTILADVAQNVAGDLLTVTPLIPTNVDPHAFEPTTEAAALVAGADALLTVGAGYETFLADLLATVGEAVPVYVISSGITMLPYSGEHDHADAAIEATAQADAESLGVLGVDLDCTLLDMNGADSDHGVCDPHVWHDVANVIIWTENLVETFSQIDPANAAVYRANGDAYITELQALDIEIRADVSTIPDDQRVLITNHDFMGYYAHAYGFEIAATVLPGSNTGSEVAPQDLAALIEQVRGLGVAAIFAESTSNPQLAGMIAEEADITVVTTLYSDALGAPDSGGTTYIEMMRLNTQTIVNALAG